MHGNLALWLILYTKTMKDFSNKFIQTLILNVATIVAIVVGIVQFAVNAFESNNGKEKVRKVIVKLLFLINTLTSKVYAQLYTDVPQVEVAQKTTKRR